MEKSNLKNKIAEALATLIANDSMLLEFGVNERSMTHQLAVYLKDEFEGYHVDCEYNRMFRNGILEQKSSIRIEECSQVSIGDLDARSAYPDIIIHRREDDDHNLVIIEAKKATGNPHEDYTKLNGFMEKKDDNGLGYEFSAFVFFNVENPPASSVEVKQQGERW